MSPRAVRLLAIGGLLGPLTFVVTWLSAGVSTKGYSAVDDAISELAAIHAGTQVAMTIGFVVFGAGVIAFGVALRGAGAASAGTSAVATACFTLAVAATPLGGPTRDIVHGVFATLGYVTLVGAPLLAAAPLARHARVGLTRFSLTAAAVAGSCLAASTIGPAHGLAQRAGLTAGDIWIVVIAVQLIRGDHLFRG